MKSTTLFTVTCASVLLAGLAAPAGAQDAKAVAGTYTVVTSRVFGDNPRGRLTLGADGRYSLILTRATLPRIAANVRNKGTNEENKAIVDGSIAHFGTYSVDASKKTITFRIETSTFANWDGTTQERSLKLEGDLLTYTVTAPSDGGAPVPLVWRRLK